MHQIKASVCYHALALSAPHPFFLTRACVIVFKTENANDDEVYALPRCETMPWDVAPAFTKKTNLSSLCFLMIRV